MLRWCSYCQQFLGEVPPYDDFAITHGLCAVCETGALSLTESELAPARILKSIQDQLSEAGRNNDLKAAKRIICAAAKANVKAVDVLMGIVAPMLYRIGEDWARGVGTAAQHRRFTTFCEKIYALVAADIPAATVAGEIPEERVDALLMNAPGNTHRLGVRILALWLADKGVVARVVDEPFDIEALVALIGRTEPRLLLVSMSLPEQVSGVVGVVERIAALPEKLRPKIIVGGYAVKQGLVCDIPGADLVADISLLAISKETVSLSARRDPAQALL